MSGELLSYADAAQTVRKYAQALQRARMRTERVPLSEAAGRVLAQSIRADEDQPAFARTTRDGYACRAKEIMQHDWLPVLGSTHAGEPPASPLPATAAWEIMTGAPVPDGADAVVMLEHVDREGDRIRLHADRRLAPGENVVARGAQGHAGDELVPPGVVIGTAQIALAATCGAAHLEVFVRPRVAILTTGDELVAIDAHPGPGQIRNSNAPMLAALVTAAGGEPWVLPTAADTAEALDAALLHARQADMLLISGGVSAGKFDLVEPALEKLGATFHFTGIRIQPGKPLVFGDLDTTNTTAAETGQRILPFFGLPGNPISSAATFLLFGAPVLAALAGRSELGPHFAMAQLAQETDRKAKPGLTRFLPARCEFGTAAPQVTVIAWQGSGDLPAFARANCFLAVPDDAASLDAGAMVRVLML